MSTNFEFQDKTAPEIKEDRPVRPWDLFNHNVGRVSQDVADERYEICKSCEFCLPVIRQCIKCGCFMKFKTTLPNADCPEGKWGKGEKVETW